MAGGLNTLGLASLSALRNADPEDDAAVRGHAGVTLDYGVLHLDRAAHGVDDAAEFDDRSVAGAL
jgi:hypothetical protein